ncbi:MAG: iron transporter [Candidatus Rokuibacteriota bacterium]
MRSGSKALLGCALLTFVALAASALGQQRGHEHHHGTPPAASQPTGPGAEPSRKVTMEELHRSGGVPLGWKFALPGGDPVKGRQVFADLECYKCHAVQGANFPATVADEKNVGPELSGMGGQHPGEYFAESILTPNAVILDGPGYIGPDGKSIMPSFADSLSVAQLVDLVAFLKSLTAGGHHAHAAPAEKTAGDYTVRLDYRGGGGHAGHEGHAGHGAAAAAGHLMVFVVDRTTGEPVPYLPVSATIRAAGKPVRTVKLAPMIGGRGFHYGVNVTVPDGAYTITVAIGPLGIQAMPSARGRFAKPLTVVFERGA